MEPVSDFKDKDSSSQVPLTAAGKPVSVFNPSSLIPQLPRDSRGSLEVFNPSSFSSSSSAHRPQQLPSRYVPPPPTWSPLPQDDPNSPSESVQDQSGFEKWTIGNRDVERLWDNKKGEMAERAAEWGLVLKRDEETGEAAGVEVRKSGDDLQQPAAAGHVRTSGTSRKDSGGGGGGGSVRSSTEDTDGGDHHQIGSAAGGSLPRVSRDLKEALSAFQQTFVVSDATKADYPILYASAGFFKMTGYTAKEVIGRNCRFLQGAGTDPGDVSRIRESLQTGTSFCGRLLNYKKDGSPFWNLLTITPIKDDTGKILKFIGMQVEVSKHTEGVKEKVTRPNGMPESLIRYDARQKDMAVSSMSEIVTAVRNPAALGLVTDQSTITKVLKPFRRRSEGSTSHEVAAVLKKQDAIGRRYSENSSTTPPTSSRRSSETTTSTSSTPGFLTSRQSMESITEEPPLIPPESTTKKPAKSTAGIRSLIGKMRKNSGVKQEKLIIDQLTADQIWKRPEPISPGKLEPVSGLGNNGEQESDEDDDDNNMINVPHEKKREMRRGLDLATTLERIEKNFVITDPRLPDNPIIFASDSFLELTEYSREEILGKNCRFLQGPETDRATVRQIRQAIDNQREVTVQLINYTKSGKKFWNLFHLQPMRDQKGEVQYFIGVQLDGSEHVEPLHNGLPEFAAAEGEKLVKETAANVDEAARELPDANLKPEDLWIKHSKPVHAKPHRKEDPSWKAIEKVLESGEQIGLKHLKPIRPLGSGDTGSVHLVELRGTGLCFAMKAMDKNVMLNRNKVHRACAEREILDMLDHPFLPALYASFQTKTHVCLVTDYCPGGELFMLLDRQPTKVLNEAAVRFYAAEVVIALEYLHCQGIIYRDLKPENILLQQNGHIALTDFDLSCLTSCKPQLINTSNNEKRKHQKIRTPPIFVAEPVRESNSFVGTEEYIAPEIIAGAGHTSAVDWWALGILLYEMFYGYTPFRGKTRQKTFTNILQKDLKFPASIQVSLPARQLMYSLLIRDPKNRLGSHEGANEIKQHLFFRGINWPLVRCMEPPKFEASQVEDQGAELGDKAIEVTSDWKDDNGLQDLQANVF